MCICIYVCVCVYIYIMAQRLEAEGGCCASLDPEVLGKGQTGHSALCCIVLYCIVLYDNRCIVHIILYISYYTYHII